MRDRSLANLLDKVWSRLQRAVADRRHPARHPTLATIGPDGPEARTLVLRGVDRSACVLDLHTDALSPKAAQISEDPRIALHVWIPDDRLQIRLGRMPNCSRAILTCSPRFRRRRNATMAAHHRAAHPTARTRQAILTASR